MLSFEEATKLLQLCQIPYDVQQKILILFLGYGTPSANIIKPQIKYLYNKFHNSSLVERIILENDTFTLWRIKVLLNNCKCFNTLCIKNPRVLYELQIAYLKNGSYDWERFTCISNLLEIIETDSTSDLFEMFNNLDKNNYDYLGTPTANIIRNAISNEIINKFDPIIGYEVDQDV